MELSVDVDKIRVFEAGIDFLFIRTGPRDAHLGTGSAAGGQLLASLFEPTGLPRSASATAKGTLLVKNKQSRDVMGCAGKESCAVLLQALCRISASMKRSAMVLL